MISRYEVSLNGVPLSSLHPDILILDIGYTPAEAQLETYTTAKRNGSRIHRRYYAESSVTVSLMIRSYDTRTRQSICQQIGKWARGGGILKTSDRQGQRLRCLCKSWPTIASALKYTDTVQIVFTAYNNPFWEEDSVRTLTLSGTSGSGSLYIPGDAPEVFIEAEISATNALSSIVLTVGKTSMTISGTVSKGSTVILKYDDEMIQSIKNGSTSLLNKRTGSDDLIAVCGESNNFSFQTSASAKVTFKARGQWL